MIEPAPARPEAAGGTVGHVAAGRNARAAAPRIPAGVTGTL